MKNKTFVILIGSVLGVALIGWLVLISGLFKKDKKPKDKTPEIPEGYVSVFRRTKSYSVSEDGEKTLQAEYSYDEFGRLIKETDYNVSGSVSYEKTWSYNSRGGIGEYRRESEDGVLICEEIYDDDGNLLSVKDVISEIHFYDDLGKPTKTEYYSRDKLFREDIYADAREKLTYSYEFYGNSEDYYQGIHDGRILMYSTVLDENGRVKEIFQYNDYAGAVDEKVVYERDNEGNVIKISCYSEGILCRTEEYEYEDKTAYIGSELKPTKKIVKRHGIVEHYKVYEYMPDFGAVSEEDYSGDGTRYSVWDDLWGFFYQFDSYGNPCKRMERYGDKEVLSEENTFTRMIIPEEYMTGYDRKIAGR